MTTITTGNIQTISHAHTRALTYTFEISDLNKIPEPFSFAKESRKEIGKEKKKKLAANVIYSVQS